MLIVCPNCGTSYQVAEPAIGTGGRSVRCARCQHVWFAGPPTEAPVQRVSEPAAAATGPASDESDDSAVAAFQNEFASDESHTAQPQSSAGPGATPEVEAPDAASPPTEPSLSDLLESNQPQEADLSPSAATDTDRGESTEPAPSLADIPIPVENAPPLAPEDSTDMESAHAVTEPLHGDIESIAARRRPNPGKRRALGARNRLPVILLALVAVCAALIGWRRDIVRQMPQLASFYALVGLPVNLRGLAFTDVKVGSEMHDGVPILVVEGVIASTTSAPVDVPRLRFALRNAAGAEVYSWTAMPSQSVLGPGQTLPFRSRLASPPKNGHDVQVRFFTRRDAGGDKP